MKWTIYYIDYSTDRVFPIPKCYACSSCKARCQTLSKHFFPPQQQPLNPCLAPVLWLLSWRHHRLPGKVEGHSCLSSLIIFHWSLLCTNICWDGESLEWQTAEKTVVTLLLEVAQPGAQDGESWVRVSFLKLSFTWFPSTLFHTPGFLFLHWAWF